MDSLSSLSVFFFFSCCCCCCFLTVIYFLDPSWFLRTKCFRLFRPTTSTWCRLARNTTWLSTYGIGVAASKWPPTRCRPRWRPSRLQRTAPTSWRWVTGTSNFGTWNILDRPRFVFSFDFNNPTFRFFIFLFFSFSALSYFVFYFAIDWLMLMVTLFFIFLFSSTFYFIFGLLPIVCRLVVVGWFLSVIHTGKWRACAVRSIRNLCRWWAVRPFWASSATTTFVTSDAVAVRWATRRTPSPRRASSVNSTTVASWTNGSN